MIGFLDYGNLLYVPEQQPSISRGGVCRCRETPASYGSPGTATARTTAAGMKSLETDSGSYSPRCVARGDACSRRKIAQVFGGLSYQLLFRLLG